jgi:hypothetical protein
LVDAVGKNMKNSTIDKKFLNQVTCIDIFNCNWLWYLVDAVEMLLPVVYVEMVRTPSRGLGLSSRTLLRDRSTT